MLQYFSVFCSVVYSFDILKLHHKFEAVSLTISTDFHELKLNITLMNRICISTENVKKLVLINMFLF